MTRIPLHIKFSNLNVVWAWKNPLKIDVLKGVKNRLATITIVQDSKQQRILVWSAKSSVENLFPHRITTHRFVRARPDSHFDKSVIPNTEWRTSMSTFCILMMALSSTLIGQQQQPSSSSSKTLVRLLGNYKLEWEYHMQNGLRENCQVSGNHHAIMSQWRKRSEPSWDADFWQLSSNGIKKRRKNYSWSWSYNQDFSHGDDVMDLKLK